MAQGKTKGQTDAGSEAQKDTVLCGASAYTKKFYLDPRFGRLPQTIRDELKIMCVLYTEEVGGTIMLHFADDGELMISTDANENDFSYDEIGAALKVRQLRDSHRELLQSMELYYKMLVLGQIKEG